MNTTLSPAIEAVEQIQAALANGPTAGPWSAVYDDESLTGYGVDAGHGPAVVWLSYELDEGCPRIEDAEFIAACNPENIRAVLALLAAKQEELDKMRAHAERYRWLNANHDLLLTIRDNKGTTDKVRLRCGPPLDSWIDAAISRAALSPSQGNPK